MKKVMVLLQLNQGCFIIAGVGLATAIGAIALVIFYSLIELILSNVQDYKTDDTVNKIIVVIILLNSIMLLIANGFLLAGLFFKKSAATKFSAYLLFLMVTIDIIIVVMGPIACFFAESACVVIKKSSYVVQVVVLLGMMIHMDLWAYYMSCIFSTTVPREQL